MSPEVLPTGWAPIDPLSALYDGAYRDGVVDVAPDGVGAPSPVEELVSTSGFDVTRSPDRIVVRHRVPRERIDDDLAGMLNDELFAPGWLRGPELFERIFTGVVRSSALDPLESWELFYRNTLDRIAGTVAGAGPAGGHGTIADYAPVYAHAEELVLGTSVLELGSCFGFLSLRLAEQGLRVTASDISPGSMRLLATVADRLAVPLGVLPADAARVEAPDHCADTVLAVHLLEHVDDAHGQRVLDEAVRLATRRVVVAVPLEDQADPAWGHLRTVSLADLTAWAERRGATYDVHERHGGWLVLDR